MLSRLLATIREHGLVAPGDGVLVAVSGGPDSMALLHGLVAVAARLRVTLRVATVDHGLRLQARDEAAQVARAARALGLPCDALRVDVAAARAAARGGVQETARRLRLAALAAYASRHGCARVALGHTADDQAETVLFRIVRGTGLPGLAGIPYRRGPFVRPLLDVRRAEILRFLAKRRVAFVDDPSNADRRYARARVRHEILPALRRENPRVVEALLGLADDARRRVRASGGAAVGDAGGPAAGHGDAAAVAALPRRARAVVEKLAAAGQGTRRVDVAGGTVEIRYGRVVLEARAPEARVHAAAASSPAPEVPVSGPGAFRLAGTCVVEVSEPPAPPEGDAALFDADALARPLLLRAPRPGDRMRPRGGRGSRKLQDLLVDAKIPRPERGRLPVLADARGAILWVAGLRPSEVARPSETTRRWFAIRRLTG